MAHKITTHSALLNGSFSEHLTTGKPPRLSAAVFGLLFLFFLIRLLFSFLLGPGFDEAYYYSYSLRPALSYFDHPPLVALFAGLFPKLTGIHTIFACRLTTVIFFTLCGYYFAKLARFYLSESDTIFAVILFNSIPVFLVCAGLMVLPDGPMSFFWVVSLYCFWKILHLPYSRLQWIVAGFFAGLTMLGKYHGVLLIGFLGLYLLLHRRELLSRSGPYLFAVAALCAFSPVLIWNYQNDFVSFLFQGQRAVGTEIDISDFFEALGGQAAYLTPFVFFQMYYVMLKVTKDAFWMRDLRARFFFYFGVCPVTFFLLISTVRSILPHWPLAGYLVLTIPLAYLVAGQWRVSKLWRRYYTTVLLITFGLYGLLLGQAKYGILHLEKLAEMGLISHEDVKRDATLDTYGWEELDGYLQELDVNPEKTFLFTGKWYIAGEVELATGGKWDVFCFNRHSALNYGIWAEGVDLTGKNGIFITTDRHFTDPIPHYSGYFEKIGEPHRIPIYRGGYEAKNIIVYEAQNLRKNFEYHK